MAEIKRKNMQNIEYNRLKYLLGICEESLGRPVKKNYTPNILKLTGRIDEPKVDSGRTIPVITFP